MNPFRLLNIAGLRRDMQTVAHAEGRMGIPVYEGILKRGQTLLGALSTLPYVLPFIPTEEVRFIYECRKELKTAVMFKPLGSNDGPYPLVVFDAGLRKGVPELPFLAKCIARMGYAVLGTNPGIEVEYEETDYYVAAANRARDKFAYLGPCTALVGISSGASMMLLMATRRPDVRDHSVCVALPISPYADLAEQYNYAVGYVDTNHPEDHRTKVLANYLRFSKSIGKTPTSHPAVFRKASPIRHVSKIDVPVRLLHGIGDEVVPAYNSIRLYKAFKQAGKDVELNLVVGEGIHAPVKEMIFDLPDLTGLIATIMHARRALKQFLAR